MPVLYRDLRRLFFLITVIFLISGRLPIKGSTLVTNMRSIWLVGLSVLGLLLGGCGLNFYVIDNDTNVIQNSYNQPIFWRDYPMTVVIDRRFSDRKKRDTISAIQRWNIAAEANILTWEFSGNGQDTRADGYVWTTECHLGIGSHGRQVLGSAYRYYDTDGSGIPVSIRGGYICMWDEIDEVDWYPVMLHELGHIIGLNHDSSIESIMQPFATSSTFIIMPDDVSHVRTMARRMQRNDR